MNSSVVLLCENCGWVGHAAYMAIPIWIDEKKAQCKQCGRDDCWYSLADYQPNASLGEKVTPVTQPHPLFKNKVLAPPRRRLHLAIRLRLWLRRLRPERSSIG